MTERLLSLVLTARLRTQLAVQIARSAVSLCPEVEYARNTEFASFSLRLHQHLTFAGAACIYCTY